MDAKKILLAFIRVGIAVVLILALFYAARQFGAVGYDFGYRVFTEPAMEQEPGTDVLVQIKDDMSNREIGQLLEEKGLVRDGMLFYIQLELSAYKKKIIPGVYTLNTSMSAKDMIVIMATEPETETEEEGTEVTTPEEDDSEVIGGEEEDEPVEE